MSKELCLKLESGKIVTEEEILLKMYEDIQKIKEIVNCYGNIILPPIA